MTPLKVSMKWDAVSSDDMQCLFVGWKEYKIDRNVDVSMRPKAGYPKLRRRYSSEVLDSFSLMPID
jgi:hypothetical protein